MSHRNTLHKELTATGFVLIRSKNHLIYRNAQGETVVVPNHNKMNENTFRSIMKKIGRSK